MNLRDKWLRVIHKDITNLPTSYINLDDLQLVATPRRCKILNEKQLRIKELTDAEAIQCMIAFTHPAYIQLVADMKKGLI